jgi:hypothetical protein
MANHPSFSDGLPIAYKFKIRRKFLAESKSSVAQARALRE